MLELFALIAPATSVFPLEKPIECDKKNNFKMSSQKKAYAKSIWSAGKFKPLNQIALKETNDIGQYSDIDFKTFLANQNDNVQVLSIGDSFVEALQVINSSSFHGISNNHEMV